MDCDASKHESESQALCCSCVPEALPALGCGYVPQARAVVQAAAGHKVSQVVESSAPHSLRVVAVGGHTALLLKAPQLDARVS